MDGFSVDVNELDQAATTVRGASARIVGSPLLSYTVMAWSVGHRELASALEDFNDNDRNLLAGLGEWLDVMADQLTLTALTYRQADEMATNALSHAVPTHAMADDQFDG